MKNYPISFIKHFKTITHHKVLVCFYCFKVGLYSQGLTHDLSKYSYTEMKTGVKYYVGYCSPIDIEKKETGYSAGWLHHKGRNKHHIDYWIDKSMSGFDYHEIPKKYVKEMVCDRIAASKIYLKSDYTDDYPYTYFTKGLDQKYMHPKSRELLRNYLMIIQNNGLKKGLKQIKSD